MLNCLASGVKSKYWTEEEAIPLDSDAKTTGNVDTRFRKLKIVIDSDGSVYWFEDNLIRHHSTFKRNKGYIEFWGWNAELKVQNVRVWNHEGKILKNNSFWKV